MLFLVREHSKVVIFEGVVAALGMLDSESVLRAAHRCQLPLLIARIADTIGDLAKAIPVQVRLLDRRVAIVVG